MLLVIYADKCMLIKKKWEKHNSPMSRDENVYINVYNG